MDEWRPDGMQKCNKGHRVNAQEARYATRASWLLKEHACPLPVEQWLTVEMPTLCAMTVKKRGVV